MTTDLLFSILPRLGKVPMRRDQGKVVGVSKDAFVRKLNDEEKVLISDEERKKKQESQHKEQSDIEQDPKPEAENEGSQNPESNKGHLDIYI